MLETWNERREFSFSSTGKLEPDPLPDLQTVNSSGKNVPAPQHCFHYGDILSY